MTKILLPPWTVLSSREVFKDRWINLRAERCQTAAGAIVDPYYVIHRHDWACVLALDAEDRAVMVRVWRQGTRAVSLELPAGAIDGEDASPADAVRRELLEETGYGCGEISPVAKLATSPANMTSHVHVFLARGAVRMQAPTLEPGETLETELMSLADLKTAALTGGITHAVQVSAILLGLDRLERR
jgi:8-oxo-dGTP pyrophosphatase MutT (NUDIX family)